jgi:hypothetical protein
MASLAGGYAIADIQSPQRPFNLRRDRPSPYAEAPRVSIPWVVELRIGRTINYRK